MDMNGIYNSHTFLRQHKDKESRQGRSIVGGSWAERPRQRESNMNQIKHILTYEGRQPTQGRPHNPSLEGMGLTGGSFFGDLWDGVKEVAGVVKNVAPLIPLVL